VFYESLLNNFKMKLKHLVYILSISFLYVESPLNAQISDKKSEKITARDPLKQPFSSGSIWNMPIGENAQFVHAGIERAMAAGMTIDEDIIVMKPDAPETEIYTNYAGWNREKDRCIKEGPLLFSAPIPREFTVSKANWDGITPNSGMAVLMPDRRTIKQTQPFARCTSGEGGTSRYMFDNTDIYGDGYYGAHGGSGLSAIGGTLRVGELISKDQPIKHVLKINVFGKKNLYYDDVTKGCRWPAKRADGYASKNYGTTRTKPANIECRMGALLALPPTVDLDKLNFETIPSRILAQAFQDYGAYIVDNTAWDVYAIVTEWGPDGRVTDEFEKKWGFSMKQSSKETPWSRDMDKIFLNLHIVVNNSQQSIGGGGKTRAPMAPELIEP
jgi:hypothetical protein